MWYEWFFDGIGTEIVVIIIGLAITITGPIAYKNVTRNKSKQKQIAGDNAKQRQEIKTQTDINEGGRARNNLKQIQKAGDNADQSQIGRINNGRK